MYCAVGHENMMTATCVKMSARRSLASMLGEPDHEQNKTDFTYWNDFFDNQFQQRWGIDPKRDLLDSTKWKKVRGEEVPKAYSMRSLESAFNPKRSRRTQFQDLPIFASARAGSLVTVKPLGEVNTNSLLESSATITRPVTPSMDDFLMERSCDSPIPTSQSPETPPMPTSTSPSSDTSPSPSTSRKRKHQTTINEYFQNTKKAKTAKKRLSIN